MSQVFKEGAIVLMDLSVITMDDVSRRTSWIARIQGLSGSFSDGFDCLLDELANEIESFGTMGILAHLRLCGAIPEAYGHDSSEEKLYSKYTDAVLSLSFSRIGLSSLVLQERADSADVE